MPSVFSKIIGADNRVYLYGAIVAISALGIIHFKQSLSSRDEIQMFSQQTSINKMDLITTELPLLIAPFAAIDSVHYLTEIIYHSIQNKSWNPDQQSLQYLGISSLLGFALPLVFVMRNKSIKSANREGIRNGVRRFFYHISTITGIILGCGFLYRSFLWSLKYSVSTPFLMVSITCAYHMYKKGDIGGLIRNGEFKGPAITRLVLGGLSGYSGVKVYGMLKDYEQRRMSKIYGGLRKIYGVIMEQLIFDDIGDYMKYVLLGGILTANLYNLILDSVVSKYFMPFSFKIRNKFMDADNQWIYESYYYYMNEVNYGLPKDIFCEIFKYAGIEEDFRLWMENDECRIKYEEKHAYVQELMILAHIIFSYVSYRQLYNRIKIG